MGRREDDDRGKRGEGETSPTGARSVKRGSATRAIIAFKPFALLALALVFFNKRGACAEESRKSKKETACGRAISVSNQAGNDRRQTAQHKPDDVFVRLRLTVRKYLI
jgi:hypothetical protein